MTRDNVTSLDFDCRYLREDPNRQQNVFSRFVKELGVELPPHTTMRDAARLGWITPSLRIRIPPGYYEAWTEFPSWNRASSSPEGFRWADLALFGQTLPELALDGDPPSADWYLHPYDAGSDPDIAAMLQHKVDPRIELEPLTHASGATVYPWVDYYAYWQVHRLAESIDAALWRKPLYNLSAANDTADSIAAEFQEWQKFSQSKIQRAAERFEGYRRCFEWVSLYRTMLAPTVYTESRVDTRTACLAILQRIGRSVPELEDDIRDVLLVLWRDWSGWRGFHPPQRVRDLLQQDVQRACDFVAELKDEATNYRDARWYFTDGYQRRHAQLRDVLPYEHWLAREELPRFASAYLHDFPGAVVPWVPVTKESFESLAQTWWPESYGLRRFAILFKRLHDLFNPDRKALLVFRDHNVVDYLSLLCLVCEKILAERWRRQRPTEDELPAFEGILGDFADEIGQKNDVHGVRQLLKGHRAAAQLHALKRGDALPFVTPTPADDPAQVIFAALHNLRVIRNYAAHHDALDYELAFEGEGSRAIRAVVTALALILGMNLR